MKKHNVIVYEQGELILKAPSGDPNDFTLTLLGNLNVLGNSSIDSDVSDQVIRNGVSSMVTGNTENGISVTYNSTTEKLDFIVNTFNINLTGDARGSATVDKLSDTEIPVTVTGSSSIIVVEDGDEYPATTQYGIGFHAVDAINSPDNPFDTSIDLVDRERNYTGFGILDSVTENRGFQILVNNKSTGGEVSGRVFVRTKTSSSELWTEPKPLAWLDEIGALSVNSPTLTLSGDATGTATFINLNDASMEVEVVDDSHEHTANSITGLDNFVKDTIGTMVSGNVEEGIEVTYNTSTKKLDFNVTVSPSSDWNSITNKPYGEAGTVYYLTDRPNEVETDFLYHETRIIDTQDKLDFYLTQAQPTPQEVFNEWYRFSHKGDPTVVQSVPAETDEWEYISAEDRISCLFNSTSHIGFVSKLSYDEYTHEATISSSATDDDAIGLVIAFDFSNTETSSNGALGEDPSSYSWGIDTTSQTKPKECTLSVIRTRTQSLEILHAGGESFNYAVVYNYGYSDSKVIANGTSLVADVSGNYVDNFAKLKVVRTGNIIKVYTTDFSDAPSYDGTYIGELTVDLTSDPDLLKFLGKKPYGYSCLSQPNSSFYDIIFSDPNDRIFDARDDTSWVLQNNAWVNEDVSVSSTIGYGRIIQDQNFRDMYFTTGTEPEKIMEGLGTTSFTEQDFINLYNARNYNFDVTLNSGQSQTFDVSAGITVPFNQSELIVDIKVLDQDSESVTYNQYIDAYGIGIYAIPQSGSDIIITNIFSSTLSFKVNIRV